MRCAIAHAGVQRPHPGLTSIRDSLWVSASAYALALSYFSGHFAALAWVALVPLFVIVSKATRAGALRHGLLWGFIYFSLYGLIKSDLSFATLPAFVTIGIISTASLTLCINVLSRRIGFNPVVLGLVWLVLETMRIELLVHTGTLANSIPIHGSRLDTIAFTGLFGLSFLIVLVNVCLIWLWQLAWKAWSSRIWRWSADHHPVIDTAQFSFAGTADFVRPEERGPPRTL